MTVPERKQCSWPGCSSEGKLRLAEMRGETRGIIEWFCPTHYRFTTENFSWWGDPKDFWRSAG